MSYTASRKRKRRTWCCAIVLALCLPLLVPAPICAAENDIAIGFKTEKKFDTFTAEEGAAFNDLSITLDITVRAPEVYDTRIVLPMDDEGEFFSYDSYSTTSEDTIIDEVSWEEENGGENLIIKLKDGVGNCSESINLVFKYMKESGQVSSGTVLWKEITAYVQMDGIDTGVSANAGGIVTSADTYIETKWMRMQPADDKTTLGGKTSARIRVTLVNPRHTEIHYPFTVFWEFPEGTKFGANDTGRYTAVDNVLQLTIDNNKIFENLVNDEFFFQDDIAFYLPEDIEVGEVVLIERILDYEYVDNVEGSLAGAGEISYEMVESLEWKLDRKPYHTTGSVNHAVANSRALSSRSIAFTAAFGPASHDHISSLRNSGSLPVSQVEGVLMQPENGSERINFDIVQLYANRLNESITWNHWSYFYIIADAVTGDEYTSDTFQLDQGDAQVYKSAPDTTIYWNLNVPKFTDGEKGLKKGEYVKEIHVIPTGAEGDDLGVLLPKNGFGIRYYFINWGEDECWPDETPIPDYAEVDMSYQLYFDDQLGNPQMEEGPVFSCVYARDGVYGSAIVYPDDSLADNVVPGTTLNCEIRGSNLGTYAVADWMDPLIFVKVPADLTIDDEFETSLNSGEKSYSLQWFRYRSLEDEGYNIYVFVLTGDEGPCAINRNAEFTIPVVFDVSKDALPHERNDFVCFVSSSYRDEEGRRIFNMADGSTFDMDHYRNSGDLYSPKTVVPADEEHENYADIEPAVFVKEGHKSYKVKEQLGFIGIVESRRDHNENWQAVTDISISDENKTVFLKLNLVNAGNVALKDVSLYTKLPYDGDEHGTNIDGTDVARSMFSTNLNEDLDMWRWALTREDQEKLPIIDEAAGQSDLLQLKTHLQNLPLAGTHGEWIMGNLDEQTGILAGQATASFFFYEGTIEPKEQVSLIFEIELPDFVRQEEALIGMQFAYTATQVNQEETNLFRSSVYKITSHHYTVVYNENLPDATLIAVNLPDNRSFDLNAKEPITVSAQIPAIEGYLFDGWNTWADGKGTSYSPGDTVEPYPTSGGQLALYAQWKVDSSIQYLVRFIDNKSFEVVDEYWENGGTLIRKPDYKKDDPLLIGWRTEAEKLWIFEMDLMPADDLDLFTVWLSEPGQSLEEKYTVDYMSNGEKIKRETLRAGAKLTPPDVTYEKHILEGWTDEEGRLWNFEEDMMPPHSLVLTARWKADDGENPGTSGGRSASLTVEGLYQGKTIYSKTETVARYMGETIIVTAPDVRGYVLDDEGSKEITVKRGNNYVGFNYEKDDAAQKDVPPILNREDHIWYIAGYPDGSVRPESNLNRAEAAAIFYRLLDDSRKTTSVSCTYSDVDESEWFYHELAYLTSLGIISGEPDTLGNRSTVGTSTLGNRSTVGTSTLGNRSTVGTSTLGMKSTVGTGFSFRPYEPITRAEFTVMAAKCDVLDTGILNYSDVKVDHWVAQYIGSAAGKGWISGYPDTPGMKSTVGTSTPGMKSTVESAGGTFKPDDFISRAEAVTLINQVLERNIDLAHMPDNVRQYTDLTASHWAYCGLIEASHSHIYEKDENGIESWIVLY